MWPWEHLAVGYLLYSPLVRARAGAAPEDGAVVALAVGTQFPDLVDKPLAWTVGLIPASVLAHAVVVAVPVTAAVWLLAGARGRGELGVAFGVGYLSHLAGDVVYPVMLGDAPGIGRLLWPFVDAPAGTRRGFVENVVRYLVGYVEYVGTPAGRALLGLEVALLSLALLVWVYDGRPGLPTRSDRAPGRG